MFLAGKFFAYTAQGIQRGWYVLAGKSHAVAGVDIFGWEILGYTAQGYSTWVGSFGREIL
jgi:hypothetical protein